MKLIYKLLVCLCVLNFSCESTVTSEELIDTRKAEAEKKFEQFYACYEIAKTSPEILVDKINWDVADAIVAYGESNVYQIGIESFKDLSQPLDIPLDGTRRREHADMAKIFNIDLSVHKQPHTYNIDFKYSYHSSGEPDDNVCANAIRHFLDSKYLLINRLRETMPPIIMSEDPYMPGYAIGDVLVFDLQKTKLIGGFKIGADSKDQYSLREGSDPGSNLMADVEMSVYDAIKNRFKELTPSLAETHGFEF